MSLPGDRVLVPSDRIWGSIRLRFVDEHSHPVTGVEVGLLPADVEVAGDGYRQFLDLCLGRSDGPQAQEGLRSWYERQTAEARDTYRRAATTWSAESSATGEVCWPDLPLGSYRWLVRRACPGLTVTPLHESVAEASMVERVGAIKRLGPSGIMRLSVEDLNQVHICTVHTQTGVYGLVTAVVEQGAEARLRVEQASIGASDRARGGVRAWDTVYDGTSDSEGHFRIGSLPGPGDYILRACVDVRSSGRRCMTYCSRYFTIARAGEMQDLGALVAVGTSALLTIRLVDQLQNQLTLAENVPLLVNGAINSYRPRGVSGWIVDTPQIACGDPTEIRGLPVGVCNLTPFGLPGAIECGSGRYESGGLARNVLEPVIRAGAQVIDWNLVYIHQCRVTVDYYAPNGSDLRVGLHSQAGDQWARIADVLVRDRGHGQRVLDVPGGMHDVVAIDAKAGRFVLRRGVPIRGDSNCVFDSTASEWQGSEARLRFFDANGEPVVGGPRIMISPHGWNTAMWTVSPGSDGECVIRGAPVLLGLDYLGRQVRPIDLQVVGAAKWEARIVVDR